MRENSDAAAGLRAIRQPDANQRLDRERSGPGFGSLVLLAEHLSDMGTTRPDGLQKARGVVHRWQSRAKDCGVEVRNCPRFADPSSHPCAALTPQTEESTCASVPSDGCGSPI